MVYVLKQPFPVTALFQPLTRAMTVHRHEEIAMPRERVTTVVVLSSEKKRRMERRQCCRPKVTTRFSSMLHKHKKSSSGSETEDERPNDLVLPALDPK